jgi:hypothetical protein
MAGVKRFTVSQLIGACITEDSVSIVGIVVLSTDNPYFRIFGRHWQAINTRVRLLPVQVSLPAHY